MAQVDRVIKLEPGEVSEARRDIIKRYLTFRPDGGEKIVWCYKEFPNGELWLPRGAWQWLPRNFEMRDKRSFPKMEKHDVNIELDYQGPDKKFFGQRDAVNAM